MEGEVRIVQNGTERPKDLGLRMLAAAARDGSTAEVITRTRAWCAEDGHPPEAIEAAYEDGYRQFDDARNAEAPTGTA